MTDLWTGAADLAFQAKVTLASDAALEARGVDVVAGKPWRAVELPLCQRKLGDTFERTRNKSVGRGFPPFVPGIDWSAWS